MFTAGGFDVPELGQEREQLFLRVEIVRAFVLNVPRGRGTFIGQGFPRDGPLVHCGLFF